MAGLFEAIERARTGATAGPKIAAYDAPKTAVVALDLQRDFLADDARMPIARERVEPLVAASNLVLEAARKGGHEVVYIGNAFPAGARLMNFFRKGAAIAGSPGAELDPRVARVGGASFTKEHRDAFTNPELDAHLRARSVDAIVLFGVFAGACLRATALAALERGYRVTLVREAVGGESDAACASAIEEIERRGGVARSAEEVARALAAP